MPSDEKRVRELALQETKQNLIASYSGKPISTAHLFDYGSRIMDELEENMEHIKKYTNVYPTMSPHYSLNVEPMVHPIRRGIAVSTIFFLDSLKEYSKYLHEYPVKAPDIITSRKSVPSDLLRAEWTERGLCPECGSEGRWIAMAAVCEKHGKFLG